MTRKSKRIVTLVIGVALVAVWAVFFIRVNREHPPVPCEVYHYGETYKNDICELTMLDSKVVSGEETKEILRQVDPSWYREIIEKYDSERIRMCLVTMHAKNVGEEDRENVFTLVTHMMMTTRADIFSLMYHDVTEVMNTNVYGEDWAALKAGEEKTWTLYFFLDSSWMSASQWNKIETMPFELIVDDYPTEIIFSTEEKKT